MLEERQKEELIRAAMEARERAYAPYSHYKVGAAILRKEKDAPPICGCNVENASYGATNCAERSAVFAAVGEGHTDFAAIAIVGGAETEASFQLSAYAYPCGICRQVLREFADHEDLTVLGARSVSDYQEFQLSELLPNSFGPAHL